MKTNPVGSFLLILAIWAISLFILHVPMVIQALIILAVLTALHKMILFAMNYGGKTNRTPARLISDKSKSIYRKLRA